MGEVSHGPMLASLKTAPERQLSPQATLGTADKIRPPHPPTGLPAVRMMPLCFYIPLQIRPTFSAGARIGSPARRARA
jgi:hypothetical protein